MKEAVILMPVLFGQDTVAYIQRLIFVSTYTEEQFTLTREITGRDSLSVALEEILSLTAPRPGDGHRACTN